MTTEENKPVIEPEQQEEVTQEQSLIDRISQLEAKYEQRSIDDIADKILSKISPDLDNKLGELKAHFEKESIKMSAKLKEQTATTKEEVSTVSSDFKDDFLDRLNKIRRR